MKEAERSFSARVIDIRLESRVAGISRWQIALDRTMFSPRLPAGVLVAIAPSGAQLEVPVHGIVEEGGLVWHLVDKPLTEGTEVSGWIF